MDETNIRLAKIVALLDVIIYCQTEVNKLKKENENAK